jgi:hypothetical protein
MPRVCRTSFGLAEKNIAGLGWGLEGQRGDLSGLQKENRGYDVQRECDAGVSLSELPDLA